MFVVGCGPEVAVFDTSYTIRFEKRPTEQIVCGLNQNHIYPRGYYYNNLTNILILPSQDKPTTKYMRAESNRKGASKLTVGPCLDQIIYVERFSVQDDPPPKGTKGN